MKRSAALFITAFMAVYLFTVAGCSPPNNEKRDTRPAQPEPSPSPIRPPVDPWKTAAEGPVPRGPVGDAQRFLLDAPAYQFTTEWEDLINHRKAREDGSVVRNVALQIESAGPHGKDGIITDGKREFVFYQGRYGQEPGDAAATLDDQLKNASLRSLLDESEEHTPFLGPDKVDGVEAEIYALTARLDNARRLLPPAWSLGGGHLRVWVAKEDHRPLRVEIKENYADPQKPGMIHTNIQVRSYRYDPNVKVTLPGL